jgi:salicylate hydroxylase
MIGARIGIVGAGIGGLTAANALLQKGFVVKVFDQASHFVSTAGAGFGFSPNGQICLASLGLHERTQEMLHPFHKFVRLDLHGKMKVESMVLQKLRERIGFSIGGCVRADLVDVLLEPLKDKNLIHYSHKMTNISQDENKVRLDFEGHPSEEFDFVIGADGIYSRVAEVLDIDDSPPVYAGSNIFYGVTPGDIPGVSNPILKEPNTLFQTSVPGEFIFFRCGPKTNTIGVWAATYPSSTPPKRGEWGQAETSQELQGFLPQFPPAHPIHELVPASNRLLHFGLFYRKHKKVWFKNRVCLLGDSCHATLPFVGQGANQAIEDGIVLANCLSNFPTHSAAFAEYYRLRYDRTRRVVNMGTVLNKLYHSKNFFVQRCLDMFLSSMLRGGFFFKQLEKEILDHCPVKDFSKYR